MEDHIENHSVPGYTKRPSKGLLIATSVFGLLYLAFIIPSFIPSMEGSPVSTTAPFKPFDLEQIFVKLLFLIFLVGYLAVWKNEGVGGGIFCLWYVGMWCLEIFVVAPIKPKDWGGGIAMGFPLFVLGILHIVRWHKGKSVGTARPSP